MASLDKYFPKYLQSEGGFVNHPNDPGGSTNKGITLATYRIIYGEDKTVDDLKKITESEVKNIVDLYYWQKVSGDKIKDQRLAELLADHGVNAGVWRANKMAQYILNNYFNKKLSVDGITGPNTVKAINSVDPVKLGDYFAQFRHFYYNFRANNLVEVPSFLLSFFRSLKLSPSSSQKVFLNGWLNRVEKFSGEISFFLFSIKAN